MRIKNFTLMVLALLMSTVSFAQKPANISQILKQNVALQQRSSKAPLQFFNKDMKKVRSQQATAAKKAPAKTPEVVVPPAGSEATYYTATGTGYTYGNSGWNQVAINRTVEVVWDGYDVVYIKGLSTYMPESYIKGTFKDETTVVFEKDQYLGALQSGGQSYPIYAAAQDNNGAFIDIEAQYDGDADAFTFTTVIGDVSEEDIEGKRGLYAYIGAGLVVAYTEEVDMPVEAPTDLVAEDYLLSAYDGDDNPISFSVKIGFKGSDVYVQGLCQSLPEAWVKGTLEDGKITFPTGQMLGTMHSYTLWFLGTYWASYEGVDLVFDYDAENGVLATEGTMVISIDKTIFYDLQAKESNIWTYYEGITIQKVSEKPGTPANPTISGINFSAYGDMLELGLVLKDTEDNTLVADKVTYKVYCDKGEGEPQLVTFSTEDYTKLTEDMTEIPFNFTDNYDFVTGPKIYLNMEDYMTWKRIGVQTIYYGGDERHESEIGWYTPVWPKTFTLPSGLKKTEVAFKGSTVSRGEETPFERNVYIATVEDSIYIQGIGEEDATAWVKGVKSGDDTYILENAQYMGVSGSYVVIFVGMDAAEEEVADIVLKKDATAGVYEFQNAFAENAGRTDRLYTFTKYAKGATIAINGEAIAPVEAPEDLVVENYAYKGVSYSKESNVSNSVKIGFKDNDVYVQGISTDMPDAWVKGTLNEGTVTFAAGQFLGGEDEDELYFIGYNVKTKEIVDVVFNYSSESNTFEIADADVAVAINAYKDQINKSIYQAEKNVTMTKINDVAATPAAPVVTRLRFTTVGNVLERSIPLQDVDGNDLVADKLSYVVLADTGEGEPAVVTFTKDLYPKLEADMTEIPATFTDNYDIFASGIYLNMDHSTWKRVGLQSIYRGGNEEHKSEITWYNITWYTKNTLPEGLQASAHDFKGQIFLNGQTRDYSSVVNVAISEDQNDFYIQGLGRAGATGWVKGSKNADGNYVFSNGQFMGTYKTSQVTYTLFFTGVEVNDQTTSTTDVTLLTDVLNGEWKFQNNFSENIYYVDSVNPLSYFLAGATISFAGTGINGVEADKVAGKAVRYNMAGQRVGANYKGIVVEQGRKIVVK